MHRSNFLPKFLVIVSVVLWVNQSFAQCVDYTDFFRWTGHTDLPSRAYDVEVVSNLAYVANYAEGLQVLDITDPEAPQIISQIGGGLVYGIAVSGDFVLAAGYISDTTKGIQVINVSDPENPEVVAAMPTDTVCMNVVVAGDFAYAAASSGGLLVVGISDPSAPEIVGHLYTSGNVDDLAVSGSNAILTGGDLGVQVVDISDPVNPQLMGNLDHQASGVDLKDGYAYVTSYHSDDGTHWLDAIDITDPLNPIHTAGIEMDYWPQSVSISGELAYVIANDTGSIVPAGSLSVVDISIPESMQALGKVETSGRPKGVAVSGDHAFVAEHSDGLSVYQISNPTNPADLGFFSTPGRASGLAISGLLGFVADQSAGLLIFDMLNPEDSQLLSTLEVPGVAEMVVVSGSIALVTADWPGNLHVIDVSDPVEPLLLCSVALEANPSSLAVDGSQVFIGMESLGLLVLDISDPEAPLVVGQANSQEGVRSVTCQGQYVFATGESGMMVFDVSLPADPEMVVYLELAHHCRSVAVSGDYAYISNYELGLLVVDISNPLEPFLNGATDAEFRAYNATISGDVAYLAGPVSHVVNIENPLQPKVIGCTGSYSSCGEVLNGFLISASSLLSNPGLRISPIQCTGSTPVLLFDFLVRQEDGFVSATWELAAGSDPSAFQLLANNGTDEWEVGYQQLGAGAFLAQDNSSHLNSGGAVSYRLMMQNGQGQWSLLGAATLVVNNTPALSRLYPPFPNPMNPRTTVSFYLPDPGFVDVAVYDLSGKKVASLGSQWRERGMHETTWNGQNAAGHPVAAGQYMIRLESSGSVATQKVILAK